MKTNRTPLMVFETSTGLVFTSRKVMYDNAPVLVVSHDAEDGAWQFLHGDEADDAASAMVVHPEHLLERDRSLMQLADLPHGWLAWRDSITSLWSREPAPPEGG